MGGVKGGKCRELKQRMRYPVNRLSRVWRLQSLARNRIFLVNTAISKCFVFYFVAWLPGAWNSLYSIHALQKTCCSG